MHLLREYKNCFLLKLHSFVYVCVTNSGGSQGDGGGRGRAAMNRELDFIQGQNLKYICL